MTRSSYLQRAASSWLPFGIWIPADKTGWFVAWWRTTKRYHFLRATGFVRRKQSPARS